MEGEGNMRRFLCAFLLSVLFLFAPAALAAIGTVNFEITAVWQGGYEGPLTLTLYANGEKMDPQPEYEIVDGDRYVYSGLTRCDSRGRDIVYTAKEHYFKGYVAMYVNKRPHYSDTKRVYHDGVIINRAVDFYAIH